MSDQVDQLFDNFAANPFAGSLVATTPQERAAYEPSANPQPQGWVGDGVVDMVNFATGIIPPRVVNSLPALPDSNYPAGSTVYLTTDKNLYRTDGTTWTASIPSVAGGIEIVGTLPTLPDSAYPQGVLVFLTTDEKLYRNTTGSAWSTAVDGADIEAGTVTANAIAAGTITGAKIAATTITASNIAAGTITSNEIAADTITAGQIAAGAIGASEIAANAVTADKLMVGNAGSIIPISNGGFETGALDGWSASQGAYVELSDASSITGFSGAYRGVIYKDPLQPYAYLDQRFFPARTGEVIRVSALLRAASGTITARFQVVEISKTGTELNYPQSDVSVSTTARRYGASITLANPSTVLIAVRIFNITDSSYLLVDDVVASRAVSLVSDDGNTIIDSSGITVTNGKITVTNPGSTVIIDGTSNMFKIAASGTLSRTTPANTAEGYVTTLSGLGTMSTTPGSIGYLSTSSAATASKYLAYNNAPVVLYGAGSSGGAVNVPIGGVGSWMSQPYTKINASNYCDVGIFCDNSSGSGVTNYLKYYVLIEAAM